MLQDFLLWCTAEVGYLQLADGFVQSSSIMPQKRNPVALEHARALASKALGQAGAILLTVHNTPFGDIVDTEDDLQPLVASMFDDATRAVTLVAAAMATAEFNRERMAERARLGWITVTELADTLTREHQVPFKKSHAVACEVRDRIRPPSRASRQTLCCVKSRAKCWDGPSNTTKPVWPRCSARSISCGSARLRVAPPHLRPSKAIAAVTRVPRKR